MSWATRTNTAAFGVLSAIAGMSHRLSTPKPRSPAGRKADRGGSAQCLDVALETWRRVRVHAFPAVPGDRSREHRTPSPNARLVAAAPAHPAGRTVPPAPIRDALLDRRRNLPARVLRARLGHRHVHSRPSGLAMGRCRGGAPGRPSDIQLGMNTLCTQHG